MVGLVRLVVMVVAALLAAAYIQGEAHADSVRLGPVYSIQEPDMLDEIQSKLEQFKDSGALQRWQEQAIAKAKQSIVQPPSRVLPRAFEARTWLIDPSYVVPQDVSDQEGRVFAHAGDRVNPLERGLSLRQPLVFLDGTDAAQVQLVSAWLKVTPAKVILTSGRWQDVGQQLAQQVFFDQRGALIDRFGIQAVPAVVEQDGNQLRVTEIAQ